MITEITMTITTLSIILTIIVPYIINIIGWYILQISHIKAVQRKFQKANETPNVFQYEQALRSEQTGDPPPLLCMIPGTHWMAALWFILQFIAIILDYISTYTDNKFSIIIYHNKTVKKIFNIDDNFLPQEYRSLDENRDTLKTSDGRVTMIEDKIGSLSHVADIKTNIK